MSRGLFFSTLLHLAIFFLMLVGLPSFFKKNEPTERVITVDILPISSVTNVKPEQKKSVKPEEKKEEPKEKPKPKTKQEEPVEKKAEPLPDKVKEKKKEVVKKKSEKEKPKKKKDEDFDSVLRSVEKIKEDKDFLKELEKDLTKDEKNKRKGGDYNPNIPLSISERDAIIQQISGCWNIPAGAKDAGNMLVKIYVKFGENGAALEVKIVDTIRYASGDAFFVAAADSAVRAVKMCSPLKGLPKDKYSTWKEIELNFDPKEMIY